MKEQQLADLIGRMMDSGGYVVEVFVRQQVLHGICYLLLALFSLVAIPFVNGVMKRMEDSASPDAKASDVVGSISQRESIDAWRCALIFILIIMTVSFFCIGFVLLFNPGYYAVKDILQQMSGLVPHGGNVSTSGY